MSFVLAATMLLAIQAPPPGMSKEAVQEDRDALRLRTAQFANCVIRKEPDLALAYVLRPPRVFTVPANSQRTLTVADAVREIESRKSPPDKMVQQLMISNCLFRASDTADEVGMRFPGDSLRYALADGLFRRNYRSRPPLTNLEQIPEKGHIAPLSRFGECLVRSNPSGSHALLSAGVLEPQENAAFTALKPAMSACLAGNSTVKLSKMLIRGAVAYNYVLLANGVSATKAAAE